MEHRLESFTTIETGGLSALYCCWATLADGMLSPIFHVRDTGSAPSHLSRPCNPPILRASFPSAMCSPHAAAQRSAAKRSEGT